MFFKLAIKNLFSRRRNLYVSLAGISISIALLVAILLILKGAQESFAKPLEDSGADMIVQLQGEPCVWSPVKLPLSLNPIPIESVKKINELEEVEAAEGSLIAWAFSNPPSGKIQNAPSHGESQEILAAINSGELEGQPCDYGPEGSFCDDGSPVSGSSEFRPIVVAGIDPKLKNIGPIKKDDLETLKGEFFSETDSYVAILDKDFARTRNLDLGDGFDLGQVYFRVKGIINPGRDAKIAGAQAFIPLKTAIEMTNRGNIVDIVFVKLKNEANPDSVEEKIKNIISENVTITSSDDFLSVIAGFSRFTQGLGLAILIIVVLAALLYISKTAFGTVLERSNEIGVLKGIGWQNKNIIKLILAEHLILGLAGGVIGAIIGYIASLVYKANLGAVIPYYLNPYPPCSQYLAKSSIDTTIPFSPHIFLIGIILSVAILELAGLFAVKKVLKLTPADAMRKI